MEDCLTLLPSSLYSSALQVPFTLCWSFLLSFDHLSELPKLMKTLPAALKTSHCWHHMTLAWAVDLTYFKCRKVKLKEGKRSEAKLSWAQLSSALLLPLSSEVFFCYFSMFYIIFLINHLLLPSHSCASSQPNKSLGLIIFGMMMAVSICKGAEKQIHTTGKNSWKMLHCR